MQLYLWRKTKPSESWRHDLRIPNPYNHVAFENVGDLTVELVESSVQNEEGLPGRCHDVLAEKSAAHHDPVPAAPRPVEQLDGLFQALDHLDFAGAQLHKQHVGLTARAAEHVVLVDLCERALERQIGKVQVGVDVEGFLDLSPLRNGLDPHQAIDVIHCDQVVTIWRHVRGACDVTVLPNHAVCNTV